MGKCPKCEKMVTTLRLQTMDIYGPGLNRWAGVACLCPHCGVILSAGIDPVALRSEIISEVVKRVKKR